MVRRPSYLTKDESYQVMVREDEKREKVFRQSCPYGLTEYDLQRLFGDDELMAFRWWMRGQTMTICDGQSYNHDTQEYEPTPCSDSPHGIVAYPWDVERYLSGMPVVD